MIKENLKLVLRRLRKEKIYAGINILGLTIALTAALLIYSHLVKEWRTDRFHQHGKEIYRVIQQHKGDRHMDSYTSTPLGPYTKARFPEIKEFVRIVGPWEYQFKGAEDTDFTGTIQCINTDIQFFEVFSFPLVAGAVDKGTPEDWMIISESLSKRYFQGKNPIGEIMVVKNPRDEKDKGKSYHIAGIMKDIPAASTLQADVIADFSAFNKERHNSWGAMGVYTYFWLQPTADRARIEEEIPKIVEKNYPYLKADEHIVKLQALRDIYFHSDQIQETIPHGSRRMNFLLSGVTLLILLLASCNYWMIKLAFLNRNTARIAVQRCFGANNFQLKQQLFCETALYAGGAFGLAMIASIGLHPFFVHIISPEIFYKLHFTWVEIAVFIFLLLSFAVLVSRMLAFYVLKRLERPQIKSIYHLFGRRGEMKKALLGIQMCIFISLLFCSVVLVRQMNYIKSRPLGYDYKNVISLSWMDRNLNMHTLRSELMQHPDIISVSNGYDLPLIGDSPQLLHREDEPDKEVKAFMIHGDADYITTYRMNLSEGRNIDVESYPANLEDFMDYRPERCAEIIINRKFAELWGQESPIGKMLYEGNWKDKTMRVVGVVEDFHFLPLYEAIQPAYIIYDVPFISYNMVIQYREGKRTEALKWLKNCYERKFANSVFLYHEYEYAQLYRKDIILVDLINVFTLIAILISGMGIFAFSMFMVESRRKEIALRKVNGAVEWEIIRLLNKEFAKYLGWAGLIGLPLAYYGMHIWLEGFAYRTSISGWIYVIVIGVAFLWILLVTTRQIWRAAINNPVKALKGP